MKFRTLSIMLLLSWILLAILTWAYAPPAEGDILTGVVGEGEINLTTLDVGDITLIMGTLHGEPVNIVTQGTITTGTVGDVPVDEFLMPVEESEDITEELED